MPQGSARGRLRPRARSDTDGKEPGVGSPREPIRQPVRFTGGKASPVRVRSNETDRMRTTWLPVHVSVDRGETVSEPVVCTLRTSNVPVTLTSIVSLLGTPWTGLPLLVKH